LFSGYLLNDKGVVQTRRKIMFTSLLAEALAVTVDNLNMTAAILDYTQSAAEELSLEAQQRLNLVHMGLAMASQAMEHEELQAIIEQADAYVPEWSSLT
jgi:UDP-N-acetyl-D-mannosaminuronic acid transferase (WecB/TagA/CpsF family)